MGVAAQRAKFLGFIIDTNTMRMYVPKDRMDKLEAAQQQLLAQDDEASARELASVAGKAMSMAPAIPAVRCLTRETYNLIRPEEGEWDVKIPVSEAAKKELLECVQWLTTWNRLGAPIRRPLGAAELSKVLQSCGRVFWHN